MSGDTLLQLCWPAAEQASTEWHVLRGDERLLLRDALVAGSRYQLILPAQWLLYEQITLPAKTQRQAMQALPFMVEEQLACDLDAVHIAVGRKLASGEWPVLVVKTELLQQIIALFNAAECVLTAIYSDAQLADLAGKQLQLQFVEQRVLVAGMGLASALNLDEAAILLPLLLDDITPEKVLISGAASTEQQQLLAAQWQTEFEAAGAVVTRQEQAQLAVGLHSINVLQGAYAAKIASPKRAWIVAACAVLITAWLAQLAWQIGSGMHWDRRGGQYMALAEQVYRNLFPQATSAADPKRRVESFLLGQQGSSTGGKQFGQLFGEAMHVYQALPDRAGMAVNQLRFDAKRGVLEFELAANNISQLDNFKQALAKAGLSSRMGSASDTDKGIIGRIQISGAK